MVDEIISSRQNRLPEIKQSKISLPDQHRQQVARTYGIAARIVGNIAPFMISAECSAAGIINNQAGTVRSYFCNGSAAAVTKNLRHEKIGLVMIE